MTIPSDVYEHWIHQKVLSDPEPTSRWFTWREAEAAVQWEALYALRSVEEGNDDDWDTINEDGIITRHIAEKALVEATTLYKSGETVYRLTLQLGIRR